MNGSSGRWLSWRAGSVLTALALATPLLTSCTATSTTGDDTAAPTQTQNFGWDQDPSTSTPPKKPVPHRKNDSRPKSAVPAHASGSGIPGTDAVAAKRLTILPATKRAAARNEIAALATKGRGPKTGYSREKFGYAWTDRVSGILWGWNSCSTRDDILRRDLNSVKQRDECVVVAGTFTDPYTGQRETFSKFRASAYPVDHVIPLSYGWQLGAAHWSADKREQFANDPLNLVLTTQSVNSAKSDSGPASYLIPYKAMRCAYSLRFAQVANKYILPVTTADKTMMTAQCR
ncbi:MAG: HNH endonuclease family protein [Candidatus Nanopelagicales bacterium]